MKCRPRQTVTFLLTLFVVACESIAAQSKTPTPIDEFSAEVFSVPELPLNVQQAALVKTEKGFVLRCQISNSSEDQMIGLRYSLVIDNTPQSIINRSEGFKLKAFTTRRITFQTPLRVKLKPGQRVILMLDQAVSTHSIWEVVKSRDALHAYLSGDYSVVPSVIRVANQIDAPLSPRIIYRER